MAWGGAMVDRLCQWLFTAILLSVMIMSLQLNMKPPSQALRVLVHIWSQLLPPLQSKQGQQDISLSQPTLGSYMTPLNPSSISGFA
jgi:hypothetical protein